MPPCPTSSATHSSPSVSLLRVVGLQVRTVFHLYIYVAYPLRPLPLPLRSLLDFLNCFCLNDRVDWKNLLSFVSVVAHILYIHYMVWNCVRSLMQLKENCTHFFSLSLLKFSWSDILELGQYCDSCCRQVEQLVNGGELLWVVAMQIYIGQPAPSWKEYFQGIHHGSILRR